MQLAKLRIGVSACLLGERTRYDGGDRRDSFLTHTLAPHAIYVPLCPETGAGLTVPREPIRLTGEAFAPQALGRESGRDYAPLIQAWSENKIVELAKSELSAVVLKARSPSCGLNAELDVGGARSATTQGLFARRVTQALPLVPVAEESQLTDATAREHFISRIFLMNRWREQKQRTASRAALVDFHSRNKFTLFALSPEHQRVLGQIVAAPGTEREQRIADYEQTLIAATRSEPSRESHCEALRQVLGHLSGRIDRDDTQEFLDSIGQYRQGDLPLLAVLSQAARWVRRYGQPYLRTQTYLHPEPLEMKLRSQG